MLKSKFYPVARLTAQASNFLFLNSTDHCRLPPQLCQGYHFRIAPEPH